MTEREKRDRGLWYDPDDSALAAARRRAKGLCFRLDHAPPEDGAAREAILDELLPHRGEGTVILSPFLTDYGDNCTVGAGTFVNHGAYFMDCAPITIGRACQIGPGCGLYTADHPLRPEERASGAERARSIVIGDRAWLGGRVTVLPGVTIGAGAVIGAGSVVTRDIPPGVVAAGNPCRVLRPVTDADRMDETED